MLRSDNHLSKINSATQGCQIIQKRTTAPSSVTIEIAHDSTYIDEKRALGMEAIETNTKPILKKDF